MCHCFAFQTTCEIFDLFILNSFDLTTVLQISNTGTVAPVVTKNATLFQLKAMELLKSLYETLCEVCETAARIQNLLVAFKISFIFFIRKRLINIVNECIWKETLGTNLLQDKCLSFCQNLQFGSERSACAALGCWHKHRWPL